MAIIKWISMLVSDYLENLAYKDYKIRGCLTRKVEIIVENKDKVSKLIFVNNIREGYICW